jgi:poly(A) polymerase
MSQEPVRYSDTLIFPAALDPDAVTVVNRLNEAGLESYFVGGCVRDLLLGLIPKDFDISTAARPRQIRRVFRNSRIIGRRFKLAHVHFGRKIIEVATFRRTPEGSGEGAGDEGLEAGAELSSADLLITRDNEFGTAEQDAVRRDFTINALLYDVRTGEVIDYVGGVPDLRERVLRTIGDPMVRFAEDPVRMLRAVKFMSRLRLQPSPELDSAMQASADSISLSAPPRVLEEIYKLMSCGHAGEALTRLLDYGLLQRLLPEVAGHWAQHRDELTATGVALDQIDRARRRVSNAFLLATLCLQPWRAALADAPSADPLLRAHELFDSAALRMSIPRRDATGMRQLLLTQLRLEGRRRSRRFRMRDFLARPSTEEGIQLLHLAARAGYADAELHAEWAQRVAEIGPDERPVHTRDRDLRDPHDAEAGEAGEAMDEGQDGPAAEGSEPPSGPGGRRRRRRRGGRRHRNRRGREGGPGDPASAGSPAQAVPHGEADEPGEIDDDRPEQGEVPFGPVRLEPRAAQSSDDSSSESGEGSGLPRPAGSEPGAEGGRRRRRHRGGRGLRGRQRERIEGGPRVEGDEPAARQGPPADAAAPAGEPQPAGAEAKTANTERGQGEGKRRSRRGGRRRRGGGGDRNERGERADRGPAREPREPREAREARPSRESRESRGGPREPREPGESNEPGGQSQLSPARPSKAKAPAPGSRLAENPEDVEDLFDW